MAYGAFLDQRHNLEFQRKLLLYIATFSKTVTFYLHVWNTTL